MKAARLQRFFVPPESIVGQAFSSSDPEFAQQLGRVLRLGVGDPILALTGDGNRQLVRLTELGRSAVRGVVEERVPESSEPAAQVTLWIALIRPERFEWALQKGTELGAAAFVPLVTERTRAADVSAGKLDRWRRIVREAAEQSERGVLPGVSPPQPLAIALTRPGPTLILTERGGAPIRQALPGQNGHTWQILSGPEGGWTETELTAAAKSGAFAVSLGARILRAETAPLVATSLLLHELGDMG